MLATTRGRGASAPAEVDRLVRRVLHPMVGLDTRIGFALRGRFEPRFAVAGAELTGVHHLLGQPEAGSYHIGGVGLTRSEALVRSVGETVERYCQLLSVRSGQVRVRLGTTAQAAAASGMPCIDPMGMPMFSGSQYARDGFPFQPPRDDSVYGWAELTEWTSRQPWQVPAQLTFVGYSPHRGCGEPWLAPAVTTGTATHRTWAAASRGALLELIQIDAAMGHWYGSVTAPRIATGARLAALTRIIERTVPPMTDLALHHLPSPDLPAHTVAAVLRQPGGRRPVVSVGLGCETRLVEACYKALLEAAGVLQLARMALSQAAAAGTPAGVVQDTASIYDLDRNVGHYADGGSQEVLNGRFPRAAEVADTDLPRDVVGSDPEIVEHLADGILATGARLFERDLTTVDAAQLGMRTARVWSPDLLPLAMPSAPQLAHPRYRAHGGAVHEHPHPYP